MMISERSKRAAEATHNRLISFTYVLTCLLIVGNATQIKHVLRIDNKTFDTLEGCSVVLEVKERDAVLPLLGEFAHDTVTLEAFFNWGR